MIKHLSGEVETVEYERKRSILLHDNVEYETFPVHWHNAVEIIMPLENHYVVSAGDTVYDIPEYDVLIVPSGELHGMPELIPGHRLIFQCDNEVLEGASVLDPIMRALSSTLLINDDYNRDIHRLAKKIMLDIYSLYYSNSEIADVKIYTMLLELFTSIREFQLETGRNAVSADNEEDTDCVGKFDFILKYIDNNYMNDITLDDLANIAGYSKFHFSRIFKQYNSMSYLQYINARRTKAAEILLLDSELSVTEVAMRSGFKSITTFNRIFKEIKHCTPTDFKKLLEKFGHDNAN